MFVKIPDDDQYFNTNKIITFRKSYTSTINKWTINIITEMQNFYIHCETEKEADKFIKRLIKKGI